jgi:uncharacterized protein with HEPN domain
VGVTRLSLFGSIAREDHGPDSDIDLLAAFDTTPHIAAGCRGNRATDLTDARPRRRTREEGTLKPRVRKSVEAEAVRLLTISEAARKLGEPAEELCPTVPWPNVRAPGNFLRHEYDRVDAERVWLMIEDDLGPLKAATQRALERAGCRVSAPSA